MSRFNVDCSTSNPNQGEEETFTSKVSKTSQKFYDKSTKNNDNIANSLFQFEMKFDSLKGYVDSVTSAVNQHAALINKLRTDLNAKHSEQNLTCAFTKFASCLNMEDLDSNFMITMVEEIDSKENDKIYQSSVNKFCQKLEGFGNRVVKMNKLNQTLTEKIQNIESDITMKVNGSDFKSKMKRTKTKMIEKIENALNIYDDKIKSIDKNCLEKIQSLEYRMKLMEESKITPNFQAIENNIGNLPKPNLSLILKETEEKIQSIDDKIEKITETTLSNIQGININFLTFREETTKNILDFKNTFDGIKILENPIFKDLEKELVKRTSQEIKNFSTQLEKPLTNFNEQIASLHLKIRDLEIFIQKNQENTLNPRIEKAEAIEKTASKTLNEIDKLNEIILKMQQTLKEKADIKDIQFELQTKVNKNEFSNIMNLTHDREEKHQNLQKFTEELVEKINKINQNFDRKVAKLKKEFDIDSLIKQFKCKADEENVQKDFQILNNKILVLNNNLISLKKEIEHNFEPLNKAMAFQSIKTTNDNPFITIKSILPKACLSCGNASIQQSNNPLIKKSERVPLREKSERPFTAANPKVKFLSTTGFLPTTSVSQINGTSGFKG